MVEMSSLLGNDLENLETHLFLGVKKKSRKKHVCTCFGKSNRTSLGVFAGAGVLHGGFTKESKDPSLGPGLCIRRRGQTFRIPELVKVWHMLISKYRMKYSNRKPFYLLGISVLSLFFSL